MTDYKKPDHWQLLARKEGYPARSVYKLKEIDEKFGILKTRPGAPLRVLDVGAAPGSWSLYILRNFKARGGGFLAAVDLQPLSREYDKGLFDGGNFFFAQGDFTEERTQEAVFSKGPYNLILSDAAPATTGSRDVDAARSFDLAQAVTDCAEKGLGAGGALVIKVFQSGDTERLLKRLKALFETAKTFKPKACRSESFELYFIGKGKR